MPCAPTSHITHPYTKNPSQYKIYAGTPHGLNVGGIYNITCN